MIELIFICLAAFIGALVGAFLANYMGNDLFTWILNKLRGFADKAESKMGDKK